jgi:predicted amidohydrolase YtcJ
LHYNLELCWDGIPSLADGLRMSRPGAANPAGHWVCVVGSGAVSIRRAPMPTVDELNAAAPETPVFVLHLYCLALLNTAALRACGYTQDTPNPPGGEIQRDHGGSSISPQPLR